jgi:hypothetical protein
MTPRSAMLLLTVLASANADTLTLRSGINMTGTWMGADARQISFKVNDEVQKYSRSEVLRVTFGQEAAMKPIEAPPAPPVETRTVSPGDTREQVVAALGQPQNIAKVGSKEIYIYKDLKVTLIDGKVSDIQ